MKVYEQKSFIWKMQTKGKDFIEAIKEDKRIFSNAYKFWKEDRENIVADISIFTKLTESTSLKICKNVKCYEFLSFWDKLEKNKDNYYLIIRFFKVKSPDFEFNNIWSEKFGSI